MLCGPSLKGYIFFVILTPIKFVLFKVFFPVACITSLFYIGLGIFTNRYIKQFFSDGAL